MRREGRLRGKPINRSRLTGRRCRLGNHRCRDLCPDHPCEKSWAKRKARHKRFAVDVRTNPALANFLVQPPLTQLRGGLEDHEDERQCRSVEGGEGAVQLGILDTTVNSVIEVAFAKMHGGHGDHCEMEENAAMVCTTYELGGGAPILAGNATDIAAIEVAFQIQLGIFENAVEGSSFSEFATQGWSTLSEESWSDVELAESVEENSDDNWSMVDAEEDEARE